MLLLDLLALDVFLNTTVFALPSEREFRRGRPTGRSAAGTEVGLLADRRSEALPPLADRPAALPILLRLADGQPFDGTAQLVATFTRRGVATAAQDITAGEVLRLLNAQGFGLVLVVSKAGVVMGAAYRDKLAAAGEADVETVMRFGVSTVRPSEDAATLARRMGDQG